MTHREELIKRIDAYIDCDEVRERESETQLLEDCRAALSRNYVPMTKDDALYLLGQCENETEEQVFAVVRDVESEVIRRAGLEVQE